MLKLASSFFVVAALVIGAIAVTRMDDIPEKSGWQLPDEHGRK